MRSVRRSRWRRRWEETCGLPEVRWARLARLHLLVRGDHIDRQVGNSGPRHPVIDGHAGEDRVGRDGYAKPQIERGLHCAPGSLGRTRAANQRGEDIRVEVLENRPVCLEIDARPVVEVGEEHLAVGATGMRFGHRAYRGVERSHEFGPVIRVPEQWPCCLLERGKVAMQEVVQVEVEQRTIEIEQDRLHLPAFHDRACTCAKPQRSVFSLARGDCGRAHRVVFHYVAIRTNVRYE